MSVPTNIKFDYIWEEMRMKQGNKLITDKLNRRNDSVYSCIREEQHGYIVTCDNKTWHSGFIFIEGYL